MTFAEIVRLPSATLRPSERRGARRPRWQDLLRLGSLLHWSHRSLVGLLRQELRKVCPRAPLGDRQLGADLSKQLSLQVVARLDDRCRSCRPESLHHRCHSRRRRWCRSGRSPRRRAWHRAARCSLCRSARVVLAFELARQRVATFATRMHMVRPNVHESLDCTEHVRYETRWGSTRVVCCSRQVSAAGSSDPRLDLVGFQ